MDEVSLSFLSVSRCATNLSLLPGVAYEFGTPEYEAKVNPSGRLPGSRSIVCVAVDLVRTVREFSGTSLSGEVIHADRLYQYQSCGWGIPIYSNQGTRKSIVGFASNLERNDVKATTAAEGKSKKGLKAFWSRFNQNSVDGLPAFDACINTEKRFSSHVPESLSSTFREIGKGGKTKTSESNIFALAKKHEAGSLLSLDENAKLFIGIVIGITLSSLFRAAIDVVKPSLVL